MLDSNFQKIGFFQEENGKKSLMRLMSLLSLLFSFFITSLIVFGAIFYKVVIGYWMIVLIGFFVVGAFAPKAIQRFAERKVSA